MVVVELYPVAVLMCFVTMLCWGSWANTQKLASKEWRFQLYYWDYAIGVFLLSVILAGTMGSIGSAGRPFWTDLRQASGSALGYAFLGGVIFNLSNILLVAAIDIAGLAVAFPIGVGLALVIGVVVNYIGEPVGNPVLLFLGMGIVVLAIIVDALAYKKLPAEGQKSTTKGIVVSVLAGVLMGWFFRFVVKSISPAFISGQDYINLQAGYLGPYTAVVLFSAGLLLSNFVWNSIVMAKPFVGEPVPYSDYFKKGNLRLHMLGILGGIIWNIGMSFSIIASGVAGPSISYGLGQGATMVAVFWGVFIWKEFKQAPSGTNRLLTAMFVFYATGLALIIISKLV
jgi:glucose uptake protein